MREAPELLHTTTLGELARSLLVLGLSDATLSSRAVLQAILALSSLHVYGDTSAVAYKANAISLLIRAMNLENSEGSSFRKLVATMLLYAYEVIGYPNRLSGRELTNTTDFSSVDILSSLGCLPMWGKEDHQVERVF